MHTEAGQLEKQMALILDKYQHDKGMLVSILRDIQEEYNYLLREVSQAGQQNLGCLVQSSLQYRYVFQDSASCHVRGAVKVLEATEHEPGIKSGGPPVV